MLKRFKILKTALSLIINGAPIKHCTIVWMLRALWLVVVHELLEYRYMDDVTGNLDWASESLENSLQRAIYKQEKWWNGDKKSS